MPSGELKKPGLIVYLCGLATSILALGAVELLNRNGTNIMGLYANGIIPAGALIVGVGSGLGYAVASRMLQVKLLAPFIMAMIGTALLDYGAAQYLTYQDLLERTGIGADQYSFVQYFRDLCENMAFKGRGKNPGNPLGGWGYCFKLLEVAGYVAGATIPSLIVSAMPYCKACQQYLKSHRKAFINSLALWADVKKLPKKERGEALQQVAENTIGKANAVAEIVAVAPLPETLALFDQLDAAAASGTAAHVQLELSKCPNCDSHRINAQLHTFGVDKKAAMAALFTLDKFSPEPDALTPTS